MSSDTSDRDADAFGETPLEEPPRPQPRWGWAAGLGIALAAYLLPQLLLGLVLSIIWTAQGRDIETIDQAFDFSPLFNLVFSLVYALSIVLIIGLFLKGRGGVRAVGMGRPSGKALSLVLPAFFAYMLVSLAIITLVSQLFPGVDLDQPQETGFEDAKGALALATAFISLVVLPPLYEELLFRGILLRGFLRDFGPAVAVIVNSLLFALAHFQLNVGLDTFALGVVASILVLRTDSLWPAIALHAAKNFVAYLVVFEFVTLPNM